jgi:hypothetical protein
MDGVDMHVTKEVIPSLYKAQVRRFFERFSLQRPDPTTDIKIIVAGFAGRFSGWHLPLKRQAR